jgi:hypothetical protein
MTMTWSAEVLLEQSRCGVCDWIVQDIALIEPGNAGQEIYREAYSGPSTTDCYVSNFVVEDVCWKTTVFLAESSVK